MIKNNCSGSEAWLNKHNNEGVKFGTNEFKMSMLEKYGVEHISQLPEHKKRASDVAKRRFICPYCGKEGQLIYIKSKAHLKKCSPDLFIL